MEFRLIAVQLVLLFVLIGGYVFTGGEIDRPEKKKREAQRPLLEKIDLSQIGEIELRKEGEILRLRRRENGVQWLVSYYQREISRDEAQEIEKSQPLAKIRVDEKKNRRYLQVEYPSHVNGEYTDHLFKVLRSLKRGFVRTSDEGMYAELGVGKKKPELYISLKTGEDKVLETLYVGKRNDKDRTFYLRLGSEQEVREVPDMARDLLFETTRENPGRSRVKPKKEEIPPLPFLANLNRRDWIERRLFTEKKEFNFLAMESASDRPSLGGRDYEKIFQSYIRHYKKEGVFDPEKSVTISRSQLAKGKVILAQPGKVRALGLEMAKSRTVALVKSERDTTKEPSRMEKLAGVKKRDTKHLWRVVRVGQVKVRARMKVPMRDRRGNVVEKNEILLKPFAVRDRGLAQLKEVEIITNALNNLVAADMATPIRVTLKEGHPVQEDLVRYQFYQPLLKIELAPKSMLRRRRQEPESLWDEDITPAVYFSRRKDDPNIYIYTWGVDKSLSYIKGQNYAHLPVYRVKARDVWKVTDNVMRSFKQIVTWDKDEKLFPMFNPTTAYKIEITRYPTEKELKQPRKPWEKKGDRKKGPRKMVIRKKKGVWTVTALRKVPADQTKVKKLLDQISMVTIGEWKGEVSDKEVVEDARFQQGGMVIKVYNRGGTSLQFRIGGGAQGKMGSTQTYLHPMSTRKYPEDIFFCDFGITRSARGNAWADYEIFSYRLDELSQVVLELPQKKLFITRRDRKKGTPPTEREKASGIKASDPYCFEVREYELDEKYSYFDPQKTAHKKYLAVKKNWWKFFVPLKDTIGNRLELVFWEGTGPIPEKVMADYNLVKYAAKVRVQSRKKKREDTYDFGVREGPAGEETYVFADSRDEYSRLLQAYGPILKKMKQWFDLKPSEKHIEEVKGKETPKKKPVKKDEK